MSTTPTPQAGPPPHQRPGYRELSPGDEIGLGWLSLGAAFLGAIGLAIVGAFEGDDANLSWAALVVGVFFGLVLLGNIVVLARAKQVVASAWLASIVLAFTGSFLMGIAYRPEAADPGADDLEAVFSTNGARAGAALVVLGVLVAAWRSWVAWRQR